MVRSSELPVGRVVGLRESLRRQGVAFLELAVLCGFAVAQPVLDVTGRSPDFFLFRRADRADILVLVAALVLLPPLLLAGVEALAGLAGRRAATVAHRLLLAGLAGLLVMEVGKRLTPVRGAVLVAAGLAGAAGAAALYRRAAWVRLWLRYLTPAPLVFALLFLTLSPASRLVLAGSGPSPSPSAPAASSAAPVVMLVFDELPLTALLNSRGGIDGRVFPNFAKLARDATLYRNATGVSRSTAWAIPAMLTGRYPARARSPVFSEYPDNLFTLLAPTHRLRVFESVTRLCPSALCAGDAGDHGGLAVLARDSARVWARIASPAATVELPDQTWLVDETAAEADRGRARRGAADYLVKDPLRQNQPARFRDFLGSLAPSPTPTLHFLHLLLPHVPYRYLPSGLQYQGAERLFGQDGRRWSDERWPARLARQRHLLQLAYTDRLVGQVLERLRSSGLYDRALVVVTADHGVSFSPGGAWRLLEAGNAADIAWVRLLVKTPGQRDSKVSDRNVELVDLPATVADLLGVSPPWPSDGVSAAGAAPRPGPKAFYNVPGERLTLDPAAGRAAARGEADHVAGGPMGLFKVGRYAALVGTPAAGPARAGGEATAEIDDLDRYDQVEPASGRVPALVTGALRGLGGRQRDVAVAVNGTIGAVAETFEEDDEPARFAAMVPDLLLRPGANELALFLVEPGDRGPRLAPLRLRARPT